MKLLLIYFDQKARKIYTESTNEIGEKVTVLSTEKNFVSKDEILVKTIDVEQPEDAKKYLDSGYTYYHILKFFSFKKGPGVYFDEHNKVYRASMYGFVVLDQTKTLRIIPPLQINKDKTKAYYIACPTKQNNLPDYAEINENLKINKIISGLNESKISEQLNKIDKNVHVVTKIEVAKAKPAINGRKEYFEPIISIDKKAGKVLADGSIDFKEIDSIIQVSKNDELLTRFPEVRPENGYDIYGNIIAAQMELPKGYNRGDNIVKSFNDENIYVSAIDGCLDINKKSISVKSVAVIGGDVDYESGNVDFNGSVHVKGAVLPGFHVKATGDIIIEKNVDDAHIEAQGNITVKMGIAGKGDSKVKAGGTIKTKYILNADVETEGSVVVDDSIINSKIFSNDYVSVVSQHGKIMGGEVIARNYIEVNVSGSHNETETILTVGRNLAIERELNQVRNEMAHYKENVKDVMAQIQQNFGSSLFEDPKQFIAKLPTVKKKQCIGLLSDLSKNNKELKQLAAKGVTIEQKLVFEKEPYINIKQKAYRGTSIHIKKLTRKVEQDIENAKFYEDLENKVIRFTSSV